MVKVKTSVYIDKGLWEKLKSHASRNGMEITQMLEEMIKGEMAEDLLDRVIEDMGVAEDYELGFEPVEPEGGSVSELVRAMRDARDDSIS